MILAVIVVMVIIGGFFVNLGLPAERELLLATTTSTYDSGLLDEIIPYFEEEYGATVRITAVGTGQALELGRNGDVDVILTHAPVKEMEFVTEGHGGPRKPVMYNQFIIVGPEEDPAGIGGLDNATRVFSLIEQTGSNFVSRGDDSGTHGKEKSLWGAAGYDYNEIAGPSNADWYNSPGQGMGDTLRTASEMRAYTLSDEGTFYSLEADLDLKILASGDPLFFNQYSVIPVNSTLHANVNGELADSFADWLVSPEIQDMIGNYTRDGKVLFTPNAED